MATKNKKLTGSIDDVFKSLNKINPLSTMDMANSNIGVIRDYIDTGNWILNAALSGSIKGGIANNKIYQLAGESGAGKTFACLNIVKNAQASDYSIIWIDTEAAIDNKMLSNFGIDTSKKGKGKFMYMPVGDIDKLKSTLTTIVKDLKQVKESGGEVPKILIILDSIGMIASNKEIDDALTENSKADFTRAKGIRSLFRNITLDLGLIGVPMIYTNHVGVNIGGYGDPVVIGGGEGNKYSASVTLCLSKSKLREDKKDDKRQTGIICKAKTLKNRFAQPITVEFHIDFRKRFNKYIGVQNYISWENCGIGKGKIWTQKQFDKLSESSKKICSKFTSVKETKTGEEEVTLYFEPRETALKYVVEHLGETVDKAELYTPRVLEPVKDRLDEVISNHFSFGSDENENEIEEIINDIENSESLENENGID